MRLFFVLFCLLDAIPAIAYDVVYGIDTVAGSDWIGDNGPATRALLLQAEGIATDPNGTKLEPCTLNGPFGVLALGPVKGWNQFELEEPPQV